MSLRHTQTLCKYLQDASKCGIIDTDNKKAHGLDMTPTSY